MQIGYYPGCALHGSSNDYEMSVRATLTALGVQLKELDDLLRGDGGALDQQEAVDRAARAQPGHRRARRL